MDFRFPQGVFRLWRRAAPLVVASLAAAAILPLALAEEATHIARFSNRSVERIEVLGRNADGTYDLVLVRSGARLRQVRVEEIYPFDPADAGGGRLVDLAYLARMEHQDANNAASPSERESARARLAVTLAEFAALAETLPETEYTLPDFRALAAVCDISEAWSDRGEVERLLQVRSRVVRSVVARTVETARARMDAGAYAEALQLLEPIRPLVPSTPLQSDYVFVYGRSQVELSGVLIVGPEPDRERAVALLREAAQSEAEDVRARAELLLARYHRDQGNAQAARTWLNKALAHKHALTPADQMQLLRLVEQSSTPVRRRDTPAAVAAAPPGESRAAPRGMSAVSPSAGGLPSPLGLFDLDRMLRLYREEKWLELSPLVSYHLIAGIVIYLVLWVYPARYYLAWLKKRHGYLPLQQATMARAGGLLAVVVLLVAQGRGTREGARRRKCPQCHAGLEDPTAFLHLRFERCPSCGAQIEPAFSLESFIPALASTRAALRDGRRPGANNGPDQKAVVQTLVKAVLLLAAQRRASDVHVEWQADASLVRFRVDGVLHDVLQLSSELHPALLGAVKAMAAMDTAEQRRPQDGHFQVSVGDSPVHVRVSTIPASLGEKMVLRLLDVGQTSLGLDRLGFSLRGLEQYRRALQLSHGLILATGPTGSGKTTLLYAGLSSLGDSCRSVFTIEDPIERQLPGVTQVQPNRAADLSFTTIFRSIMRQDPNVLMVGEIRDAETAGIAVQAARAGHLVLSSFHALDTASIVARLAELGVKPSQAADAMVCCVAMRLIRTICPHCAVPAELGQAELRALGLPRVPEGARILQGLGCDRCAHAGLAGRTGVYEVLVPSQELRDLLAGNAPVAQIRRAAVKEGLRTLRQEAALKVLQGITTTDEVLRVTGELDTD